MGARTEYLDPDTERREHHETMGPPVAAAVSRFGGDNMEFDKILTADDDQMGIGERLRNKTLLRIGTRPCGKNCDDTEQIPAGGRAAGAWGLMNVLGSWPLIPCSELRDGLKLEVYNTPCMTPGASSLVGAVARAIQHGKEPQRSAEGLGGTYLIQDCADNTVAIFKPCDEEPMAPNNPNGFVGRSLGAPGLKPTVRVGEAAIREVAAYLLDKDGFANVPHTILARASHPSFHYPQAPSALSSDTSYLSRSFEMDVQDREEHLFLKAGSLQEYVSHVCDTSEMGTSRYNTQNVHRIGIFDIRLYNTDRHAGNILVCQPPTSGASNTGPSSLDSGQLELVPIDHGFCLPEALEPPYFEWLYWPQAMLPFDEEELQYIKCLDIEADKKLLRRTLPVLPEECLHTLEVTTLLLKKCAAAGLSLHEIGQVMSRPLVGMDKEQSELEKICIACKQYVEACLRDYKLDGCTSLTDDTANSHIDETPLAFVEDLQFCIDDVKDIEGRKPQCLKASSSAVRFETPDELLLDDTDGLESSLGQLSIEGDNKELLSDTVVAQFQASGAMACHKPFRSVSVQIPPALPSDRHCRTGPHGPLRQRKLSMQIGRPSHAMYPPPVEGSAPSSTNDVFSDMGEDEWQFFMDTLEKHIDDALADGHWKMQDVSRGPGPSASNFGMSCPRF